MITLLFLFKFILLQEKNNKVNNDIQEYLNIFII